MKRAIIYGRVSTNKQSAESVETQIYECKKWAKANNCTVIDIYDDSGQSGRAYNVGNRSGFQQIKEDAMRGRMDYALIHKIDRFARSAADYFSQEKTLLEYGVKIVVVGMPFLQDADIITKSVHIAVAEQFSVNLSNEVSTKMRTFARKKSFLGGKPPYGYNVVDTEDGKKLVINPEEAEGVKLIYQLYMQGYGYIQISKQLAEHGYLNKKNEPFTPTHVRKVLTSKKYNGWYVFGRREKVNGKEKLTKDTEKLIEVKDAHDKIIDDETFAAVQNKIAENVPRNKIRRRHYPFTGKIVCGKCGRAWTGVSAINRKRNNPEYNYYRCTGNKVNYCNSLSVRAEFLEDYVSEKVKRHIFDDAFTEQLIKEIEYNLSGDTQSFTQIKNKLEKELNEVKSIIKKALNDKYSGNAEEDIVEEIIKENNEKRLALEIRLENVNQQLNVHDKTDEIKAYVKWLRDNFESADTEIKSSILQQCVQSIIITDDKIEIYVYLSKPYSDGKRHYKKNLPNIDRGEPLFMINEQRNNVEIDLSNVAHGVPRNALGKQGNVYINNGIDVISFELYR